MKTKEELNALKEEVKAVNKKLAELSEEELAQVSGGGHGVLPPPPVKRDVPEGYSGVPLYICRSCCCYFNNRDVANQHAIAAHGTTDVIDYNT